MPDMRDYEALIVLQPELEDEGVEEIVANVAAVVEGDGGEVAASGQLIDKKGNFAAVEEGWSTRRLAYPIKHYTEGYFVLVHLNCPPQTVEDIEQMLRMNEDVLRFLVTKRTEA